MKFSNTRNGTPACSAPAISRSAPSRVVAIGFCSETALPAANAASAASTCRLVRQQDLHQVDPVQRQQLVVVGGDHRVLHSPRPPAGLGQGRVAVAQRHDGRVRIAQILDGMQVGDAARTDDAYANGVQVSPPASRYQCSEPLSVMPCAGAFPLLSRRWPSRLRLNDEPRLARPPTR